MVSHVSRLGDDTISMSKKRRIVPEIVSNRYDNQSLNVLIDNLRSPLGSKKSNSKSAVHSNKVANGLQKVPSHHRAGQILLRNSIHGTRRSTPRRNKTERGASVNQSLQLPPKAN